MDSILNSVKKIVGISEEDTSFDVDIIACINAVLATLNQLGVTPPKNSLVSDASKTWDELTSSEIIQGLLPTYVGTKVRLMFDPPQSGPLIANFEKIIQETEWRIAVQVSEEDLAAPDGGMTVFE